MNRRPFLRSLAATGSLLTAGCAESFPTTASAVETDAVFEDFRFDGTDLVVAFRDGVDVESVTLSTSQTDEAHRTIDSPGESARFSVVSPETLETHVGDTLQIEAATADGRASKRITGTVHAFVNSIEVLRDGRARVELENQAEAPLLVRFVAIYGAVPNPTVDPQAESVDRSALPFGPGVVGTGRNRPTSPVRDDLVIPGGETAAFETTYAPFAFPETETASCDGRERTGTVAVVHGSGGSAAYSFSFSLDGEQTDVGGEMTACDATETSR